MHWTKRTTDAPPRLDRNGNNHPDEVDATIATLDRVWRVEVNRFGYRAPLPDRGPAAGQGPNRGLDIYLGDIGQQGLYGYCIGDRSRGQPTEGPGSSASSLRPPPRHVKHRRAHAYCVLDNDFAARQFPSGPSGREALDITVAHEFFHTIQSAYEGTKTERWIREGTAEWMEDEVFDRVNANYAFLPEGPLLEPGVPLDAFEAVDDAQDFEYGSWIFWRFLSEYYGNANVVRHIWEQAAPTRNRDRTALQAVADVVGGLAPAHDRCRVYCHPQGFAQVFSEFSYWIRTYPESFREGAAYAQALGGARSVADADFVLSAQTPDSGPRQLSLDHLSSGEVTAAPDPSLAGASLRVTVDLPKASRPGAVVIADRADGSRTALPVPLDSSGHGSLIVAGATALDLILSNSSGKHDAQAFHYRVEAQP